MILSGPKNSQYYKVYDCGQKYYVAALDNQRRPVHYQGHASVQHKPLDRPPHGCSPVSFMNDFDLI